MPLFGRQSNAWHAAKEVWANVNGTWRQGQHMWVYQNNAWRKVWDRIVVNVYLEIVDEALFEGSDVGIQVSTTGDVNLIDNLIVSHTLFRWAGTGHNAPSSRFSVRFDTTAVVGRRNQWLQLNTNRSWTGEFELAGTLSIRDDETGNITGPVDVGVFVEGGGGEAFF